MDADPVEEFNRVGIQEILEADSRPTFVLDLDPDEESLDSSSTIQPVFCNPALRSYERLFDAVVGNYVEGSPVVASKEGGEDPTYEDFRGWATGVTTHDDSKDVFPLSFLYDDILWTGSTVRQRWRLISGNRSWRDHGPLRDLSSGVPVEMATGGVRLEQTEMSREKAEDTQRLPAAQAEGSVRTTRSTALPSLASASSKPPRSSTSFFLPKGSSSDDSKGSSGTASITLSAPEKAVADWTVAEPKGVLSPHLQFARTINWAVTPLGPMDKWSPEFRQSANLCMANPHPAALFWGSELTMLYNEAYAAEVAGNKHPSLMGTGFSGPFAELWDYAGPVFAECARTGISVRKENDYLPINRHGLLEETFYSWSFTPLYGGTDRILGFYNAPFETTQQVLSQRRMQTINNIGTSSAHAKTVKQFWKFVLDGLQDNHFDVPFALLYSVGDAEDVDQSSVSSGSTISLKSCYLEGSLGVPDGHIAAAHQLDLKRSRDGFVPAFREAMRTREPTLLHSRDGTLPEALLEGISWRGFGDRCGEAIIFPVRPTNGDTVLAFLVLGVNPRRPYDNEYKAFTTMLNRQLATSLASVILFEDEVRRSRDAAEAAALEKEQLAQQLDLQASRLRRMTELSPLGMFLINPEGVLREANDRFNEMTGHSRDSQYEMSWMDFITESSRKTMEEGWHRLVNDYLPWSDELQLKKQRGSAEPVNLHGESIDYWVLFSAHSEFASDGSLRSIVGSITDISTLKWAQGLQNRRLQEAEETRRQQNEFIDITSHEMRNPLSAILQCADDISSALGDYRASGTAPPPPAVIESCVDAATTISLCVQHQKSIVDDILTISKLDSNLLLITPVAAQPEVILHRAVKMFDPELQAKGIEVVFETHPSYTQLAVDWVTIDPSRVLQILINLMTNAIKFTASAEKRVISVAVGASRVPPDFLHIPGFQYVPVKKPLTAGSGPCFTASEDWGAGEVLYVRFKVEDTGCGLTPEEKQILFQRFKQASPRTHAQYGGSGLGLFISKRLAELHGGMIGVASEAGKGSMFSFFVKARRADTLAVSAGLEDPTTRDSPEMLSIERFLGGDEGLHHQVTPQRQDFASSGPGASLVATKAAAAVGSGREESSGGGGFDATRRFDPHGIDILVVEDNLINQRVLVAQLRKAGSTVHAANDGVEALAFLERTHFFCREEGEGRVEGGEQALSVVLMDLEMPNMDGLTCVREIRRMEAEGRIRGRVPVIAVTANVRDEQIAAAMRSGMDDVVSKPFRIPELLQKIEILLKAS